MSISDDSYVEWRAAESSGLETVLLYDSTWRGHICVSHPELADQAGLDAVKAAVTNPSAIYISKTDPENTVIFEGRSVTVLGCPVVVPVKKVNANSGRVKNGLCCKPRRVRADTMERG